MRKIFVICLLFALIHLSSNLVYSESSYVLPYPSSMPGSRFYKIRQLAEELQKYWYYGDFGQLIYNQKLSDKYLVEAKTLFEYNQYLLAFSSLQKSDHYFKLEPVNLNQADIAGKNVDEKKQILYEQAKKHIEVLELIKSQTPEKYIWFTSPKISSDLPLWESIDKSISIRKSIL